MAMLWLVSYVKMDITLEDTLVRYLTMVPPIHGKSIISMENISNQTYDGYLVETFYLLFICTNGMDLIMVYGTLMFY